MPDGDSTPGQEPAAITQTATAEPAAPSSRSIDAFPEDAQDYIRRLRDEAAKYRNELKDAKGSLKSFEDREKTEAQKLVERAEAAETAAAERTGKLLRYEVAAAAGIPLRHAHRLTGSTEEELKQDAENLKKDFGLADGEPGGAGGSGFDGGVRRPVRRPKSMNGLIRQASGL